VVKSTFGHSGRHPRKARAIDTTLGPDTVLQGDLRCEGSILCAATVNGHLSASGDIVLLPTSVVNGDVQGLDVTVAGRVEGNVIAEGLLVVQATAVITGRLSMARLVVDEGAYLRGDCVMESARTAE
jgi:cytoskeletal protein CcmA (bactofilin family)